MAKRPVDEVHVPSGEAALKKMDELFVRVANASNASVRERMAEKKRTPARRPRGRSRKTAPR